jgi:hypothetical protein
MTPQVTHVNMYPGLARLETIWASYEAKKMRADENFYEDFLMIF